MTTNSARGIRNNNPGNIERNAANKWQGRMPADKMTPAQKAETRFEVFATPAWGIRALAVLLINYYDRHGLDTVAKVIGRWAPQNENDTGAYIAAVARAVGVESTAKIDLHDYAVLRPLVVGIIAHENGGNPYPAETIDEGLRLAGVVAPATKLIAPAPNVHPVALAAAGASGAAAIAEVAQQVHDAIAPVLPAIQSVNTVAQTTSGLPAWLRAGISIVVLVAAGASLYTWWKLRRARKAVSA